MNSVVYAAAVICAAGLSSRMDGLKKEYQKINVSGIQRTALEASIAAFASVSSIEIIVVTVPEKGEASAREALPEGFLQAQKPKIFFVTGGNSRRQSVFNALNFMLEVNPCYVLIHDGARPWVSAALIERLLDAVQKEKAVIPLLPVTDTPKECYAPFINSDNGGKLVLIKNHLKRGNTGLAQTPQVFAFTEILRAHELAAKTADEEFTDDAQIWGRFCGPVAVIPGSAENKKITFPEDLQKND
jgi:2-C-methyl-D-erythritol 4-phosphate cytidylyltransferase